MNPFSEDLRERIVQGRKEGHSAQELSVLFKVCVRTIQRYVKQFDQTGSLRPCKIGAHKHSRLEAYDKELRAWIAEAPELTLEEIRKRCLHQLHVKIGLNALWKRINHLGLSFKKNLARRRARAQRH